MFKNHSRASRKKGRASQGLATTSSSISSIKNEIGNMLEDFKSEMLHTFSLQMDTMYINMKQEEAERDPNIFFPRCTRRHPTNESLMNAIEVSLACEEYHATEK